VNDGEYEFIQLFQCPFANIMEHLIEMPTHEPSCPHFVWHFIAQFPLKGLIMM